MDDLPLQLALLFVKALRLPVPPERLSPEQPLFDGSLGLDSVDAVQWVTAVEEHFGVHLTDTELASGALATLGALALVLKARRPTESARASLAQHSV
mgnify:CR=1 FL=1